MYTHLVTYVPALHARRAPDAVLEVEVVGVVEPRGSLIHNK